MEVIRVKLSIDLWLPDVLRQVYTHRGMHMCVTYTDIPKDLQRGLSD